MLTAEERSRAGSRGVERMKIGGKAWGNSIQPTGKKQGVLGGTDPVLSHPAPGKINFCPGRKSLDAHGGLNIFFSQRQADKAFAGQ